MADEEARNTEGWKDAEPVIFSDLLLKSALENYNKAKAIMSPEDPWMKMIDSALSTWVLKIIGVIPKDNTPEVNVILDDLASNAAFQELRDLMFKSQR